MSKKPRLVIKKWSFGGMLGPGVIRPSGKLVQNEVLKPRGHWAEWNLYDECVKSVQWYPLPVTGRCRAALVPVIPRSSRTAARSVDWGIGFPWKTSNHSQSCDLPLTHIQYKTSITAHTCNHYPLNITDLIRSQLHARFNKVMCHLNQGKYWKPHFLSQLYSNNLH